MLTYPSISQYYFYVSLSIYNSRQGSLSKLYKDTFENTSNYPTLQEALAEYSDAVTFYDHISRNDNETELVRYIIK
jgi:hypothetical protein